MSKEFPENLTIQKSEFFELIQIVEQLGSLKGLIETPDMLPGEVFNPEGIPAAIEFISSNLASVVESILRREAPDSFPGAARASAVKSNVLAFPLPDATPSCIITALHNPTVDETPDSGAIRKPREQRTCRDKSQNTILFQRGIYASTGVQSRN